MASENRLPLKSKNVRAVRKYRSGSRAWSLFVEMPISAPRPNSKPSAKRVDAFTITELESTSRRKRIAAA